MTTIYGIKNCDTVKKTQKWLENNEIDYQFSDFRSDGITVEFVQKIGEALGWDAIINKRSTTFRNLSDEVKQNLTGEKAIEVIIEQPTLIKRPVLEKEGKYYVGFKEASYQEIFNHA